MKKGELTDMVNDLGNALTAAGWPVITTPQGTTYDTQELFRRLIGISADVSGMRVDLRDSVNHACTLCGEYKREHEGACNGCRWLKVKGEFQ